MHEEFIEEIENLMGTNLVSVVKFGSEGEPNNLLFVFNKLNFGILDEIKPLIIKQRKKGSAVPLIFTKEELSNAADVFPLEFLDMIYPHKTLKGEKIIENIQLDKKHVRRQLEFELRSKLIHLRENYIWIKNDKELKQLLMSAVPSLMPLFYGLLYLKNIEPPTNLGRLFKLVTEKYKIDLNVLKNIKTKGKDVNKEDVNNLMKQLEKLIRVVDRIK